jgi:hypothetical protein
MSKPGPAGGAVRQSLFCEHDRPAYEAFLADHPHALLYYSLPYKEFLEDLLGCRSEYWLAWEGERLTGILPTMSCDGPLGTVVNSLPFFGSHGGPLAATEAAKQALWDRFAEIAARPGVAAATVVGHPLADELPPFACQFCDERVGQLTPLDGDGGPEDYLWARIVDGAHWDIKKAERSGVTVTVENDRLDFLEAAHRLNMARVSGRAKPPAFFVTLARHFTPGRDFRIYVARLAGEPVAVLLLFYYKSIVEYFIPATLDDARKYQPMALLIWQGMLDAAREGAGLWNWGGTWRSQEGLHKFKRKWGAGDLPYRYYTLVNEPRLLALSAAELLAAYPYFFVLPFDRLGLSSR